MHIYLSPHNDDVCFSIGGLASRTGGELLSAFTVSAYVSARLELPMDRDTRIAEVTDLRRREDLLFAQSAGLTRHDLGLSESAIFGVNPFDHTGLKEEVDYLAVTLVPYLLDLLSRGGRGQRSALYCPMGIGANRDHLAMLLVTRGAFRKLAPLCDVYLYEDLYYARNEKARERGLEVASRVFAGAELSPLVITLGRQAADRKLDWIGLYASQHAKPPLLVDFTPAPGLATGPHEVVWRVSRTSSRQPWSGGR
ncbi:MAG: hypothetical protein H6917_06305 [Novosphingobium sp.]|nr:hypothetical protein [Novosphingobium sp.]MCP5401981.1 hypothetical protein [Novosphingobium sp.]